jgi:hypothetical protein
MEQQQQQAKTPARPRAMARRVPGLEGVTGTLRVNVQGKPPPLFFKVHDGVIEQVEDAGGQVDATIAFDSEDCIEELLSGRLNPIVAGLQDRLDVTGNLALVAKVIFELQGQATGFGRPMVGEA